MRILLAVCLLLSSATASAQETISVLFWNVESGGNDSDVIAQQLSDLVADKGPFDLVGLTEVRSSNADKYVDALGPNFTGIVSNTGAGDRMVIAFNEDRFNLVQSTELSQHDGIALNFFNSSGRPRFRSPLVAELQEESGPRRFFFMVNHLARNNGGDQNGGFRVQQARGLAAWAKDQVLPGHHGR